MPHQPVYTDPVQRTRLLSLIGELTKLPARPTHVPAEDQLSAVLGFLADHAEPFARALCERFLADDDQEARAALAESKQLGAGLQLRLPSIGAGFLWPDVSVCGEKRGFQLLIEVKLGSDFHQYANPAGGVFFQPDAYLHAWRSCPADQEATVRRLGTLTLDGKAPSIGDQWRARDLSWADIHALLVDVADKLAPEVRLIAQELRDHLAERVLPPAIEPGFLEWGAKLTRAVCEQLRAKVIDGRVSGSFAANAAFHYAGGYLQLMAPGQSREKLWFVISPAGGDYNVPGEPASLQIASYNEDPLSAETRLALLEAGFVESKEKAGYVRVRAALPLSDLDGAGGLDEQVATAADWARERLQAAGLTAPSAGDPA